MNKCNTVIFDLDGTLMNTLPDIAASVNHALSTLNLPPRSMDEINDFVGNGIRVLLVLSLKAALHEINHSEQFDDELLAKTLSAFRSHYCVHCKDKSKPYDGILNLLKDLKQAGFKTAIVSNKPHREVLILHKEFFSDCIDIALGENESAGIRRKPAPDMVLKALEHLGANQNECVYVGDSDVDIATARNARVKSISVLWGFRKREFLQEKGAERFAHSPSEVFSMVSSL